MSAWSDDAPPEVAMLALIDEVTRLRGRLFGAGRQVDSVPALAGLHWLVLCAVVEAREPPTVARIGRSLGHPRQSIQRLADELVRGGLVRFEDNPEHQRAKLLVPAEAGRTLHRQQTLRSLEWAKGLTEGLDPALLVQTVETLRLLRRRIERDRRQPLAPDEQRQEGNDG